LRVKYLFLLSSCLVAAVPVAARASEDAGGDTVRSETIVVTATGWNTGIDRTGQSIAVLGEDELPLCRGLT